MIIYFQHETNKQYKGTAVDWYIGDNPSRTLKLFRELHPELWAWLGKNPKADIIKPNDKKLNLMSQFIFEYLKHSEYFNLTENQLKEKYITVINHIVQLDYEDISLEFTLDQTFFFNIKTHNQSIHIEVFIMLKESDTTAYCIYKDKKMVANGEGYIMDVIKDINNYANCNN